ncbi:helix-turn-helix domain-containing protein [Pseudomonas sp. Z3-8]|uniref:helix-turn-helix domain-containing protein n=1 Tax=Pseudomonas sp. Z3-8 TaxID=2817412 RepID=UPI003DA7D6A0
MSATDVELTKVVYINYSKPAVEPKKGRSLSGFLSDWTKDLEKKEMLEDAREWVGETYFDSDKNPTLKSLRLKKKLSQADLARLMNTSQPHVARIEKGSDTVTLKTLCKLAAALEEDYNTLIPALQRQQEAAALRSKA